MPPRKRRAEEDEEENDWEENYDDEEEEAPKPKKARAGTANKTPRSAGARGGRADETTPQEDVKPKIRARAGAGAPPNEGAGAKRTPARGGGGGGAGAGTQAEGPSEREAALKAYSILKTDLNEARKDILAGMGAVPEDERDRAVADAVRFVLSIEYAKPGEVILEKAIKDAAAAGKGTWIKGAHSSSVLRLVQYELLTVFGLHLTPIGESSKTYVLRSTLPPTTRQALLLDNADEAKAFRGLTFACVGLLQRNGGEMEEEEFWKHMRRMGMDPDKKSHPTLNMGPTEALAKLERLKYVARYKDEGRILFALGDRAKEEMPGKEVERAVAKMTGRK